jgi:hypothetical protein
MSVLGSVSVVKDAKGPILSASLMRSNLRWDLAFWKRTDDELQLADVPMGKE